MINKLNYIYRSRLLNYNIIYIIIALLSIGQINANNYLSKNEIIGAEFCVKNLNCIFLEIADTEIKRSKGLMYRRKLNKNKGMKFIFDYPQIVNMWMKNTYIPLDMVFLRNNKIVYIEKNVLPCKNMPCKNYGPNIIVDKVIELNSGIAEKLRLKSGQLLKFEYFISN